MFERFEIYKCKVCNNILQVIEGGKGKMTCCSERMKLLVENVVDANVEKHIPVIEKINNNIKVKVGNVIHPMDKDHYIQWIELITPNKHYSKFLKPKDIPVANFTTNSTVVLYARAYCNLHGLWKS